MNNPFGQKDMMERLEANPQTREYLKDPAFKEYLKVVQKNPGAMQ